MVIGSASELEARYGEPELNDVLAKNDIKKTGRSMLPMLLCVVP
jgi:hypothetical protein